MGRNFRQPSTLPCGTAADLIILISSEILYLYIRCTAYFHRHRSSRASRSTNALMAVSLCSTANATLNPYEDSVTLRISFDVENGPGPVQWQNGTFCESYTAPQAE